MESLYDKLKSLGVQIGAQNIQKTNRSSTANTIEEVIKGFDDTTPFGKTFIIKKEYPAETQHGNIPLCIKPNLDTLLKREGFESGYNCDHSKIAFLDTETSGLSGGTGSFAFLIGFGFQTDEGFRLYQLFLRDPAYEKAMLASLIHFFSDFDYVVTYNGKSFDIPLLNSRHILHAFPTPFSHIKHIDLLHLARRIWKNRLSSRTLGNVETEILDFRRGDEEIPGWMVPEIYYEYLHTRDAKPLAGVIYHNEMDILSLASLFNRVALMLDDPKGDLVTESLDSISLARIYEDMGDYDSSIMLYEQGIHQGLPLPFFLQTLDRYALLNKKNGNWEMAVTLWKKAATYQQLSACIELAKYYEHQVSDFNHAVSWVEKGLEILQETITQNKKHHAQISEMHHRLERLSKKNLKRIS